MPRPRRATKVDDLSAESPGPRADAADVRPVGTFSLAWRLLGNRFQVRLAGASASSLSHLVFMVGAMVPPFAALLICLAAGASTTVTLALCLPTMLVSGAFTWHVYREARTAHHIEQGRRRAANARRARGAAGRDKPRRPRRPGSPKRRRPGGPGQGHDGPRRH
ncbi:hypothetical protein [Dactylosporangium sp. CA-139066]|uniref:hypothetical protein n=1 Tax=Dactylosporangium sp. CA-139066 TaxID=3239930 RepID=UPI003D916FF2